jgi:hypothetical protein
VFVCSGVCVCVLTSKDGCWMCVLVGMSCLSVAHLENVDAVKIILDT